MEATDTTIGYDRESELKAFDDTKTGVKGLVEAGISEIPRIFRHPSVNLASTKPPSSNSMIPTIDLEGGFYEDANTRKNVVEKVREAAEKWGFFQVINHGISMDVLEEMKNGVHRFHEQDSEVKKGFYGRDKTKKCVYNSNFDLYSSPAANWRDTITCFVAPTPPTPQELPDSCGEIMMEYSKEVMKLGELILELMSEALGLSPNHLKEMDCSKGLMTLCHYYPPCPQPDLTLGLSKHSDSSFLTVLLQDHVGGLQVLHDDSYWVDVPHVPGALVINVGDLLQLITNERFISVEHRVLANRDKPRVSVACFFAMFRDQINPRVYGPMEELVSENDPPKYRATTVEEYSTNLVAKGLDGVSALQYLRIS